MICGHTASLNAEVPLIAISEDFRGKFSGHGAMGRDDSYLLSKPNRIRATSLW